MKKILALFLIFSLFSLSSEALGKAKDKTVEFISDVTKSSYTYLILGLDDSSSNTDVIILFSYDGKENSYSVLGIPRDTFFENSPYPHKLNGYLHSLSGDEVTLSSLQSFSNALSSSLGVHIDGTVVYKMETISDIIDTIGGITVNVPIEMSGFGINGEKVELKEGKQDLNGNEAVFFLRYREGYALGDLGRMDAQKMFISSFIKKIKSDFNIEVAVKLLTYRAKNVITDINTSELIAFAVKNVFKIKNSTGFFATLPGSAVFSDEGISYYSVNKKASIEIFKLFDLKITSEFDPSGVFCSDVSSLNQIYYSNDISYKVYSDKEVENLSPIVKVQ